MTRCGMCSVAIADGRSFCSRQCANRRQQPTRIFSCETCGESFGAKPRKTKGGLERDQRFCSQSCYLTHVRVPARPCAHCGCEIPKTGWSHEAKFCSRACYHEGQEHGGNWKGGRSVDPDGYARIWEPGHPLAAKDGYVREHRAVMAAAIGRSLGDDEVVHHINGDRQDNRLENLMLFSSQSEHMRHHAELTTSTKED